MADKKQNKNRTEKNGKVKSGKIRIKRTKAIIDAAQIEFSKKGFAGTSLQSIADRAGLTKWQIIYFFKNKESLYKEVINQIYSEIGSINNYFHEKKPSVVISEYLEYIFKFIKVNPYGNKLLVNEMTQGAKFAIPTLKKRNTKEDVEITVRQFQQWIVENKLKPVDPLILIFLIWSLQHFFAVFEPEVAFLKGKDKLNDKDWEHIVSELKSILLLLFNEKQRIND